MAPCDRVTGLLEKRYVSLEKGRLNCYSFQKGALLLCLSNSMEQRWVDPRARADPDDLGHSVIRNQPLCD